MTTDYTAVSGVLMRGQMYRLRWDLDTEAVWLEMSRIDQSGAISDDWAPMPMTEEVQGVIDAIQAARQAVGVLNNNWHETVG